VLMLWFLRIFISLSFCWPWFCANSFLKGRYCLSSCPRGVLSLMDIPFMICYNKVFLMFVLSLRYLCDQRVWMCVLSFSLLLLKSCL
jgi:hypothetical protein